MGRAGQTDALVFGLKVFLGIRRRLVLRLQGVCHNGEVLDLFRFQCLVYVAQMATLTITVSQQAYERLKKLKLPGDSFSDVIVRELPEPCDSFGELLESFEKQPVPNADPAMRKIVIAGRGRRSRR
jgi:hypothetical protein